MDRREFIAAVGTAAAVASTSQAFAQAMGVERGKSPCIRRQAIWTIPFGKVARNLGIAMKRRHVVSIYERPTSGTFHFNLRSHIEHFQRLFPEIQRLRAGGAREFQSLRHGIDGNHPLGTEEKSAS